VVVLDKPFQPSLMFVGKAGAYPSESPLRCSTLGQAPALFVNLRLDWKGLPETEAASARRSTVLGLFLQYGSLLNVSLL